MLPKITDFSPKSPEFRAFVALPRHSHVDSASKVAYAITNHWMWALNATMRMDVHSTWGYIDKKTGNANGMFGQLKRKEADIGGSYSRLLGLMVEKMPKMPKL